MKSSTEDFVQSLIDLVNDMGEVAYAAIVVGFESHTRFELVMFGRPGLVEYSTGWFVLAANR